MLFLVSLFAFLLFTLSPSLYALEMRGGDEVYISEKINDDIIIGGDDIKFDGELQGDIIAGGWDIVVDGNINGNVNLSGYSLKVGGNVLRSVRLAGYKVTADGRVGMNLMMAGGIARLSSTCEVQKDVNISAGVAYIHGTVLGDLDVNADEVVISGTIDGNVTARANEKFRIDRSAVILGDLQYHSPVKAQIANDAQIDGDVKWIRKSTEKGSDAFTSFLTTVVLFVGGYIVGLILLALCRKSTCSVKETIMSDLPKSFGVGAIALIVVPIAVILVLITVIGIPLAIVTMLAYLVLFYVSKLFVALALGEALLKLVSSSEEKSQALSLLIGLIILTVLFKLPWVGGIIYIVAAVLGMGGILITWNRSRKAGATQTVIIPPRPPVHPRSINP